MQLLACISSSKGIEYCSQSINTEVLKMPHMCRVTCGHCSDISFINKTNNCFVRCPHCQQVSSIGSKARRKGIFYSVAGILFVCMGIGLATGTVGYSQIPGGINVAYFLVFLSALFLFIYAYRFFRFKVSVLSSGDPV